MKTTFWGPSAWRFLHAITFAYPKQASAEEQAQVLALFSSLQGLLPCQECAQNFRRELQQSPIEPHLAGRATLSRWLVNLHNSVNARLGKPQMAYEDAADMYMTPVAQCALPAEAPAAQECICAPPPLQLRTEPCAASWKPLLWATPLIIAVLALGLLVLARRAKGQ